MGFRLDVDAAFSLDAAARFATSFPGTRVRPSDRLSYAWPLDDDWTTVQVTLTQHGRQVRGELAGSPSRATTTRARRDVASILCADVDGSGFATVGERDAVVADLQARFPGLRPVLFYTPYEAAAWTVIGHRIRMTQAASIMQRLARELGEHGAFPSPRRLVDLDATAGLTDAKVAQLRGVARAALDGTLTRAHLRELEVDVGIEQLQRLPGIGPFSAELIMVRGVGAPDLFPKHERRLDSAIRTAYGLSDSDDVRRVVERWRPYRAWVGLLLRAGAA